MSNVEHRIMNGEREPSGGFMFLTFTIRNSLFEIRNSAPSLGAMAAESKIGQAERKAAWCRGL